MADRGNPSDRPPLSAHEPRARRATWRRRRALQRTIWSLLLVAVSAAAIAGVLVGGSSGRPSTGRKLASRVPTAGLEQSAQRRPPHTLHPASATALAPIERVLAYASSVTLGSPRKRDVALTFDDGPGPYTAQILRVLERTRTPATFFVIGEWARRYPEIVRAEARAGEEVGDHTDTHPVMSLLPAAEQHAQIAAAGQAIHRAGAVPASLASALRSIQCRHVGHPAPPRDAAGALDR